MMPEPIPPTSLLMIIVVIGFVIFAAIAGYAIVAIYL